jgi:hypothetical protein
MKIVVDGKFQNNVFIESFSESRTEKIMSEEWKAVAKISIDSCVAKS